MINLLPPELKDAYRYAHRNVLLVRWLVVCAVALVGLAAFSTFGLIYVHQATQDYARQVKSEQSSLASQHLTTTQSQVKDMSSSLQLAVQVLSKEVLFSKLLTHLATITPNNAVLTDLNISQTAGALDISALTADYSAATQLQINLADPANQLFKSADIVSIACGQNTSDPRYPCNVTIRALFTDSNPYLFINDGRR